MVLGTQDDPCHLSPRTTFLAVPQHLNGCRPVAAASRSLFGCRAEPTSQRESFDLWAEINIMIIQLLVLQWCAPSSMFLSKLLNAAIIINSSKHGNHGKLMTSSNGLHELSKFQAFDWLLTLEMEISLVWTSRWNVTKVLYFLTRYLPFIDSSIVMYRKFCTGICHLPLPPLMAGFQISLASHFLQMLVGWRTSILPVSCCYLQFINPSIPKKMEI